MPNLMLPMMLPFEIAIAASGYSAPTACGLGAFTGEGEVLSLQGAVIA